ncbi:unnamed protein product [Calypogeia fissa]
MANYLLHGTVDVTIYEAEGLVDEDRKTGRAPAFFRTLIENVEDTVGLGRGKGRLYASVDLGQSRVGRTRIIDNQPEHPVWNESFRIYAAHTVSDVIITVKDDNTIGASLIGRARVPVTMLLRGELVDEWYGLLKDNGELVNGGEARVRIKMQFSAARHDPHWGRGLSSPEYEGVLHTYYPQRNGCHVTLYQDSHMADNFLPPIYLDGGLKKQPTRCWEDIYNALMGAKHLIYITGWSVYTEITLVRDPQRMIPGAEGVSLGQLLKKRADEGVRVNLLVWDDKTSIGFLNSDGLMATHDQDTLNYFQGSNVNCILCPRNPDDSLSIIQGFEIGTMFTHHQKTVIVDAPVPNSRRGQRRIVSFVGGIDLCDGRYDTQYHSVFATLNGVHHDDFHQPNFAGASIACGGPREPWHDIHSRIEGKVAWDVLHNFEQRWRKQSGRSKIGLLVPLLDVEDMVEPEPVTDPQDPETWNVQVFRSIDAGAAEFPEDPEAAARAGLVSGKDNVIDRSVQDGYINAIRRAKDFIYIENQYFLGSAFGWDDKRDCGASHLIPMELALKIVSKIEARERFAVYIVTPMWPEGVPESGSVQAILDWTHRTMSMMYTMIYTALHAAGSSASPKDYLNFYCLGNREAHRDGEYQPTKKPQEGSNYDLAQEHRRFMIYVHAKMMIVDDEYIIIGSANINERSMNGARDSEIAMGAWQPHHICKRDKPHGEIHGFRLSLWFEHLGRLHNSFLHPESVESIETINAIADETWALFTQDEPVDLPGHLLPFPVAITHDGEVRALPGIPNFPDTNAPVVGAFQDTLPSILTT